MALLRQYGSPSNMFREAVPAIAHARAPKRYFAIINNRYRFRLRLRKALNCSGVVWNVGKSLGLGKLG